MNRDLALSLLRSTLVWVPSLGIALALDLMTAARGLLPPGFRALWRRVLATVTVMVFLMIGVFAPLGTLGLKAEKMPTQIATSQLFLLHILMVITMGVWFLLGFAGRAARPAAPVPPAAPLLAPAVEPPASAPPALGDPTAGEDPPPPVPVYAAPPPPPRVPLGRQLLEQFGYLAPDIPREIGLGVLLGLAAWVAVILALIVIAGVLYVTVGQDALPKSPPAMIPLIVGLPVWTRLLVSLSAGIVEESFFRGFLQPRIGIALSTACFALAHLSYGEPFLLVGVTLLSLIYAFLVKWRQNLWPAMAAHALFDGVQLLIVVPAALHAMGAGKTAAFLW